MINYIKKFIKKSNGNRFIYREINYLNQYVIDLKDKSYEYTVDRIVANKILDNIGYENSSHRRRLHLFIKNINKNIDKISNLIEKVNQEIAYKNELLSYLDEKKFISDYSLDDELINIFNKFKKIYFR